VRKRVITAAVGVVGLVVIGLGVASATLWRADDVLVATTTSSTQLVVTDPGVLEVGGDPATIRVTAPGGAPVVLVIGRDYDVDGWVGQDAYTRVTGLASWDELATTQGTPAEPTAEPSTEPTGDPSPGPSGTSSASATASPTPTPSASPSRSATPSTTSSARPSPSASATAAAGGTATDEQPVISPDPTDSDMWFAQETGDGSAELVWPTEAGRWSLLVASAGDTTPTLSISWPRVVTTPWLWPCVIIGSLMVLVSGLLLLRGRSAGRPATWESVHTGAVPVVTGEGTGQSPTRRQLREAEQASRRTGQIPRVTTGAQRTVASTDTAPTRATSSGTGSAGRAASPAGTRPEERTPTSAKAEGPPSTAAARGRTTSVPPDTGAAGPGDVPRATQDAARPPTAPVSRRALRAGPPTGQTGVVPPPSSAARPGAPSGAVTSGAGTSGPAPSRATSSGSTVGTSSSAPTAPTASTASTNPAVPAPAAVADGERHRPSWLAGGAAQHTAPASPAVPPAGTSRVPGRPQPKGGWVPGAPSAGPDAPTPHGGPPSWAHPPKPGAPTAAWSPTPGPASGPTGPDAPRPGAPGRGSTAHPPTGPGAAAAGPTGDGPTGAGGTPVPATADPSAGSRADAWRRAWGLPPTAPDTTDGAQADDEGSER
jgi:hypothetical protein